MNLAWGRCPMSCPEPVPGWLVPFSPGGRFPDGVAVKLGIHPAAHGPAGMPCIGSRDVAPPLPLAAPSAAEGLALQREATQPAQGTLFTAGEAS